MAGEIATAMRFFAEPVFLKSVKDKKKEHFCPVRI
jgi:hypothetical protein